MSGVGGLLSPRTAVVGKNSEAIITRWFRSELMVVRDQSSLAAVAYFFVNIPNRHHAPSIPSSFHTA